MAISVDTLSLGRANIKKVHLAEIGKLPQVYMDVIGRVDKTTQQFERYKSITGLGPAVDTPEGTPAAFDDMLPLFSRDFYPTTVTKGVKFTKQTSFTDQYKILKDMKARFAKAFGDKRNIVAANLDNLGFTSTTYGMNSEPLYSTAHSNGTAQASGCSNRPAVDVAFGPLAVQQMKNEMRFQRDARNTPMRLNGQILLKVPIQLQGNLAAVLKSVNLPGTTNNDINYVRENIDGAVVDDYTSPTAWFARMKDVNLHGLFMLQQMPYDVINLPLDENLMYKWVAYESYTVGWFIWYGAWGTTGA